MKFIAFCFWKSKYTANSLFLVAILCIICHAIGFEFEMLMICLVWCIWFDLSRLQTKKTTLKLDPIYQVKSEIGTPNDCYRFEPSKWWYSINKNRAKNVLLLLLRYLLHTQFSSGGRKPSISNHRLFLVLGSFLLFSSWIFICVRDLTCRCRRIALQLEIFGLEEQVEHIQYTRHSEGI